MSFTTQLLPRQLVPDLSVPIVGGPKWRLRDQKPQNYTMLVFYRGLHCHECKAYLQEAQSRLLAFKASGVSVIALSSDCSERGGTTEQEWGLHDLPLAYGVTMRQARAWGLYMSQGAGLSKSGLEEPAFFIEPGLFLVRPDRTLYFASTQNMPFARPHLLDVLQMIEWTVAHQYPARGEVEKVPPEA